MSDVDNKVKMIVEGLLLAAGRPLSLDNIISVFSDDEKPDRQELKAVMEAIAEDCDDRGFELKEVASGFRFQVKQELSEWVAKLWEERPPRYTRALLETLALIAYRQPITRGDIEEIRGVAVSANIIRTLMDREWVRVVGHRDVPGRPAMFATTRQFLDYFNLKSLQELPPLAEIKELEDAAQDLDLPDDFTTQRVIDLPEEVVDESSVELSDAEKAELLAEEEAIELAKKPLDEILSLDPARQNQDADDSAGDEDDEGNDGEDYEPDPADSDDGEIDAGDAFGASLVDDSVGSEYDDGDYQDSEDPDSGYQDNEYQGSEYQDSDESESDSDQAWLQDDELYSAPEDDDDDGETASDRDTEQSLADDPDPAADPDADEQSDAEPVTRFGSE